MVSRYSKPFSLEVLTPSGCACRINAVSVVFPSPDGDVGVLGGRAALIAMIGMGRLRAESAEGASVEFFISGGFAHVRDNMMTVLVEECRPVEQIDAEQAWDDLQQAKRRSAHADADRSARRLIEAARIRFNIAQRARKRRTKSPSSDQAIDE